MLKALVQMEAIQTELQDLRNEAELQRREVERLVQRQRELYRELDQRIRSQERQGGLSPSTPTTPSLSTLPSNTPTYQPSTPSVGSDASTTTVTQPQTGTEPSVNEITIGATSPTTSSPSTATPSTTQPASGDAQEAYLAAFELLRQSRYEDAISAFNGLLARHPNSDLADDAQYWIAEAHYVTRNFNAALQGFRTVISRYTQSPRVPEALLKIGYVQYEMGAMEDARATLTNVINQFPDSRVAISAQTRLQKIEQQAPSTSTQ